MFKSIDNNFIVSSDSSSVTVDVNEIALIDGTVSDPSFSYILDSDTGLYRKDSNIVCITAGGNEIACFNGNSSATFTDISPYAKYLMNISNVLDDISANNLNLSVLNGAGGSPVYTNNYADSQGRLVQNSYLFVNKGVSTPQNVSPPPVDIGMIVNTSAFTVTATFLLTAFSSLNINSILQWQAFGQINRLWVYVELQIIKVLCDFGSNYCVFTVSPAITLNTWYTISLVIDNASAAPIKLYVNSQLASVTYSLGNAATVYSPFIADRFRIGNYSSSSTTDTPSVISNNYFGPVYVSSVAWSLSQVSIYYNTLYGLNTSSSVELLAPLSYPTGAAPGYVLTSDAVGLASWQAKFSRGQITTFTSTTFGSVTGFVMNWHTISGTIYHISGSFTAGSIAINASATVLVNAALIGAPIFSTIHGLAGAATTLNSNVQGRVRPNAGNIEIFLANGSLTPLVASFTCDFIGICYT